MDKNKILLIAFFLFFSLLWSMAQVDKKLLFEEICNCQSKIKMKKDIVSPYLKFNKIRIELDSLRFLNFITERDTFFMLESFNIETGISYISVWNSLIRKNFIIENNKIFQFEEDLYSQTIIYLLSNWDIKGIRKEEILNANEIPINYIYGVRVINKKKRIIDCIVFKEFYLLGRD